MKRENNLQGEIDASRNECRGNDQAADLHLETSIGPWVIVHDDPASIADRFSEGTEEHGDEECPHAVPEAQKGLHHQADGEEGKEEGIGAQIRVVAIDGLVDGASCIDLSTIRRGVGDTFEEVRKRDRHGSVGHCDGRKCCDDVRCRERV